MNLKIQTKEELETFISKNWDEVNHYIDKKMSNMPIPIYSSVDIRESKTKFAPVDNNLYPAGFNNLCQLDLNSAAAVLKEAINNMDSEIKTIAIIPESHTKNRFYLDHLAYLAQLVKDAGFDPYFVSFDQSLFPEEKKSLELVSHSEISLTFYKGQIIDQEIYFSENKKVDFAILNNDQSNPLDLNWSEVSTPIHPTPLIGWFKRQKHTHFEHYQKVVNHFSEHFSINSNLLQAKFKSIDEIDYSSKEGLETLASEADQLLAELPADSNIFVKASQGTYGMGISVVSSGEEILKMNRKTRDKMDIGKNKIKFTSAILQEGVETVLKYNEMPAEVTIYLINGKSVGGFMRVNSQKSSRENLNSRGMVFKKFCISEIRKECDHQAKEALYSTIARLSTLAAASEIKNIM